MATSNPGSDRSSRKVIQADFPGWEGAGMDLWSAISAGMAGRTEFAPLGCVLNVLKSLQSCSDSCSPCSAHCSCYLKTTGSSLLPPFLLRARAPEQPHDNVLVSSFLFKKKNPTKKPTKLISCSGEPYITDAPICAVCLWQNDRCHLSLELEEAVGRGIEIFSGSSQCLQTARSLKRGLSKESCV